MILMASSASAGVLISSRYSAIEIIPVAITKAKYPGNRSAAARKKPPRCLCVGSIIQSGGFFSGFFIAAFAIEFESKTRGATFCAEHPGTRGKRWIVPHMLPVTAIQDCAPVALVVLIKVCDRALHRSLAGVTPER